MRLASRPAIHAATAILVALVVPTGPAAGQNAGWVDGGLGYGTALGESGLVGRASLGVRWEEWAGGVRVLGGGGGRGGPLPGDGPSLSDAFDLYQEVGVLVYRRIGDRDLANPILVGMGLGILTSDGERGESVTALSGVPTRLGLPLELLFLGGDGDGPGLSVWAGAHFGLEANWFGAGVSLSVGWVRELGGA